MDHGDVANHDSDEVGATGLMSYYRKAELAYDVSSRWTSSATVIDEETE